MADAKPPVEMLQLPKDVLLNIVERCGPKEKLALFSSCQSARSLVLEAVQQVSAWLELSQLPRKPRPPLLLQDLDGCWSSAVKLELKNTSLSGLMHSCRQLQGIKYLVRVVAIVHKGNHVATPDPLSLT
jgi:hypothetical protein